jgi:hypothetical protein
MNIHKKWLLQLILLICLSFILLSIIGSKFLIKPVFTSDLLRLNSENSTVIIGGSHGATGLKPDLLTNTVSIANSGEPIFFTYYKTKALLKNNQHVKKLILTLSPIHISQYVDHLFFTGNSGSREYVMDYYMFVTPTLDSEQSPIPFLSSDRILGILKYDVGIPFNYMDDIKVIYNYYLGTFNLNAYRYSGGFTLKEGSHLSDDMLRKKLEYYFSDKLISETSDIGKEYINKIIDLSIKSDIELIIVSTPMHHKFQKEIPKNISYEFNEMIKEFQLRSPKITYLDFRSFSIDDQLFFDGDHLNKKGAKYFTEVLNDNLSL